MAAANQGTKFKRVAKRVLRPLMYPIDGRVADINRRTEHGREASVVRLDELAARLARLEAALAPLAELPQTVSAGAASLDARITDLSTRLERLAAELRIQANAGRERDLYVGAELRRLEESLRAGNALAE